MLVVVDGVARGLDSLGGDVGVSWWESLLGRRQARRVKSATKVGVWGVGAFAGDDACWLA